MTDEEALQTAKEQIESLDDIYVRTNQFPFRQHSENVYFVEVIEIYKKMIEVISEISSGFLSQASIYSKQINEGANQARLNQEMIDKTRFWNCLHDETKPLESKFQFQLGLVYENLSKITAGDEKSYLFTPPVDIPALGEGSQQQKQLTWQCQELLDSGSRKSGITLEVSRDEKSRYLDLAKNSYKKAADLIHDYESIQFAISVCDMEETTREVKEIAKELFLAPENPMELKEREMLSYYHIACILFDLGKRGKALDAINTAESLKEEICKIWRDYSLPSLEQEYVSKILEQESLAIITVQAEYKVLESSNSQNEEYTKQGDENLDLLGNDYKS